MRLLTCTPPFAVALLLRLRAAVLRADRLGLLPRQPARRGRGRRAGRRPRHGVGLGLNAVAYARAEPQFIIQQLTIQVMQSQLNAQFILQIILQIILYNPSSNP